MKKDEVMAEVQEAFSGIRRPAMFIRGTCRCEECLEHEQTMQSLPATDMPLDTLANPGWDPICFASDEAFAYLLPGLVRLVLEHPDGYIRQFLFHLENSDRIAGLDQQQRRSLRNVLDFLTLEHADVLDSNLAVDELNRTREMLELATPPYSEPAARSPQG